jgi:FMN-dependent NADH-azoreductase
MSAEHQATQHWSKIMSRILYVSSSPRGGASYSNRVAAHVIRELRQADPQTW